MIKSWEVKEIPLKALRPARYNPRKDLRDGDAEYAALTNSITTFGLVEPLVWNEATGNLVGGHQRLKVLKAQGKTSAPVVVVNLDDAHEKALNLALNKLGGNWDYEKLAEIFKDYEAEELRITGFSMQEIKGLIDSVNEAQTEIIAGLEEDPNESDAMAQLKAAVAENTCYVYLSFDTTERGDKWLAEHSYDVRFEDKKIVYIYPTRGEAV